MITELCGAEILREGLLSPRHPDTRVWSKLYRAERINGAERVRFTEGLTIGEDLLFLASLVQRDTRYVQTDRALYSYYINPRGAMERPFVPEHMDHLRCWDLAEETIRERFPEIPEDPDCRARLGAQRLIAAVLTASKIARLPSGQQAEYGKEFDLCRENIRHYRRVTGIARYLPRGYALKSFLLAHTPGLYLRLYR